MAESKHTHVFEYHEQPVLLHDVIFEQGKPKRNNTTGRDNLKQWKCTGCPVVQTYDLERTKV